MGSALGDLKRGAKFHPLVLVVRAAVVNSAARTVQ